MTRPCLNSRRPRCCLQPTPPFASISPRPFRPRPQSATELNGYKSIYPNFPKNGMFIWTIFSMPMAWDALGPEWTRVKRRRNGPPVMRLIRYADDFVVMVGGTRADAGTLWQEVAAVLSTMGLRLSAKKTRVCHTGGGVRLPGADSDKPVPLSGNPQPHTVGKQNGMSRHSSARLRGEPDAARVARPVRRADAWPTQSGSLTATGSFFARWPDLLRRAGRGRRRRPRGVPAGLVPPSPPGVFRLSGCGWVSGF